MTWMTIGEILTFIDQRRLNYVSRLSRRDDMELETREPDSFYGKRSLDDLEERDWYEFEKRYWDEFEKRYWLD